MTRFRERVAAARAHQNERIREAQAQAEPLLEELDRLCPPPFPVGPPTGLLVPNQNPRRASLHPDPPALQELVRVRELLGPTTRVRIDPSLKTVTLVRALEKASRWRLGERIKDLFRTPVSSDPWRDRFDLECLGLDQEFWAEVVYVRKRRQLRATTRRFQVREVERGAQVPLPLSLW